MKQIFSYTLLITTFILNVSVVSIKIWEKDIVIRNKAVHNISSDSVHKDHFLMATDDPFVCTGTIRLANSRMFTATDIKAENYFYHLLTSCFSQLALQQLNTTKLIYVSHYAEKEKDGYYIYTLCKLLI